MQDRTLGQHMEQKKSIGRKTDEICWKSIVNTLVTETVIYKGQYRVEEFFTVFATFSRSLKLITTKAKKSKAVYN